MHRTLMIAAVAIAAMGCVGAPDPNWTPSYQPTSAALERRDRPVTAEDLLILQRAAEILSDESVWNRRDNRVCEEDATTWSLFCALHKASIETIGEYQHRRVALQEVRFAIEDVTGGEEFENRLGDFNNTRSHAEILEVLTMATERVESRLHSQSTSASGPKIETGFAEVNGTRLYYEVAGTGDPIVLIHGNFGDRRYYDGQFEALARHHRVLRYDLRGFGQSMRPEEGVPYSDFEDLEALMTDLDIERAHLAGFSLGSAIVVDFCLAFPDRCRSLIVLGPWFFGYDSPAARAMFEDFGTIGAAAVSGGQDAALEQLLAATWWYPEKVPPRALERVKAIWSDFDFWHFRNPDPRRFLTPMAAEQLERITLPALIITAEYDLDACRAAAEQMDARIPDSTMLDLAGLTHFMFIEQPEDVNAAMLEFLVDADGR